MLNQDQINTSSAKNRMSSMGPESLAYTHGSFVSQAPDELRRRNELNANGCWESCVGITHGTVDLGSLSNANTWAFG